MSIPTYNKVTMIARLGKDPDMRYTPGGKAILNLRVATDHNYQGADGKWINNSDWHNIEIWGDQAERLMETTRKGSTILIEGRISEETWEDDSGGKHYKTKIVANLVKILDGKIEKGGQASEEEVEIAIPIKI